MAPNSSVSAALGLLKGAVPRFVIDRIPPTVREAVPHHLSNPLPLVKGLIPGAVRERIPAGVKGQVKDLLRASGALAASALSRLQPETDATPVTRILAARGIQLSQLPAYRQEFFPTDGPRMWLDAPDAEERIAEKLRAGLLTEEQAEQCRKFARDGYIVVEKLFDDEFLDRLWAAFLRDIKSGRVPLEPEKPGEDRSEWGRVLNIHTYVPEMAELLFHERLKARLSMLMGREAIPFQTIPSFRGSEQPPHSDAIHMTTYPLGFLSAAWVAFEDIHPNSGPLVYYPGSHKLPYYLSKDVGIEPGEFKQKGRNPYCEKYEPFIQKKIDELGLKPAYFTPKKGDVLIWHHNLIHGGSARKERSHTRKSVVCHFYARNIVCYHDLSGDPAGIGVQA